LRNVPTRLRTVGNANLPLNGYTSAIRVSAPDHKRGAVFSEPGIRDGQDFADSPMAPDRMRLIRTLPARPKRPMSLTIGNFDGIHRGHQALIAEAASADPELMPAMMCFEPLPMTFFRPDRPVPRVMNLRDRIRVGRSLGLEALVRCRFDHAFSKLSPEDFVQHVLVEGCRARRVVVGPDFRFGHRATGDVERLANLGHRHGFETRIVDTITDIGGSGERISSSRLRAALAAGDLATAERLLGRRYSISGRVVRGKQLGRELGYATANIRVAEPPALTGILAVRVDGGGLDGRPGVASLGRRPTVAGRDWLLEVHLFDFDGNLYGRHLEVDFAGFIRHEAHFDSLEQLTDRMHEDAAEAKRILDSSANRRQ
jgi:riboflavin kinase/FMN adenylyltransferase